MRIKHVAFVVKYFPTVSETFIVNQINGLMDAGYKVSLYSYVKLDSTIIHDSLKKNDLLSNVQYFVKPPKNKLLRVLAFLQWTSRRLFKIKWGLFFKCLNVFEYGKDAYTLKLFFEAQWFLVPNDIEIIHAHFGMNGNRIAYLKSKGVLQKKIKLINTFHGYDLSPNKLEGYKEEYKYLFKEASAFTVNTPYLGNMLEQINSDQKPTYILPVGLDITFFKKQSFKKNIDYFDLVFCGKLINWKGPDLAIEVLNKLHKLGYANVRLHMIGDGNLRHQLKKQVASENLEEFVIFYGAQSQIEVKEHFENADVFLLPGRYEPETRRAETQGLVIQEAQAMELPVVVSDVGGMKYGLLLNKSGFVVKEGNIDGFVEVIEKIILNPKLKIEMGVKGRELIESKYDSRILVEKLLEIYKKTFELN